jgi:hypothetical protein
MEPEQEKELLKQLGRIARHLEKIAAAITVEITHRVKEETHGGAEIHDSTQVILRSMEQVREEALKVLRRHFPR